MFAVRRARHLPTSRLGIGISRKNHSYVFIRRNLARRFTVCTNYMTLSASRKRGLIALPILTAFVFISGCLYQCHVYWRILEPGRMNAYNGSHMPAVVGRPCARCLPPLIEFDSKLRVGQAPGVNRHGIRSTKFPKSRRLLLNTQIVL